MRKLRIYKETGATMAEYALAAGILMAVFVVGSIILRERTEARMKAATEVVEGFTPCVSPEFGGLLTGDECI